MKYAIPAVILMFAASATSVAHSGNRVIIRDDGHECRLDYDKNMFTRGSLDSDSYRRFAGPNEDIYFRVAALPNDEKLTPNKIKKEYLEKRGTKDLVYERTKGGFLVLSGFRGQNIFYTKISVSKDNETICVLDITYPREAKRALDAIVTGMSRSFTALN